MQVSIYLDNKVVKKLDQWAKREKRSRSNLIQRLLTEIAEKGTLHPSLPTNPSEDPLFSIHLKAVKTGVADLSSEHDHYVYGTPKRS